MTYPEAYELGQIRTDRGEYKDKGNHYVDVRHPDFGRGGARGDGVYDDTMAVADAISYAHTYGINRVYFGPGSFLTDPWIIPENIELYGAGRGISKLICNDTDGDVFGYIQGSNSGLRGLTIDGRRADRPTSASGTVIAARPNGTVADGTSQAGGCKLSGNVSAAATSITLLTAPSFTILPGDTITLVEAGVVEQVTVGLTYTSGTTIPLYNPLQNSFTAAACIVTVALKNVSVEDCRIFAAGLTALTYWHATQSRIHGNYLYDAYDTCLDFSSGGNTLISVTDNTTESNGRWGIAVDEQYGTYFGPTEGITIVGNRVRILNGGTHPDGSALEGIFVGSVQNCTVQGNVIDIRSAGLAGIRVLQTGTAVSVMGNVILAATNAGTSYGIRLDALRTDTGEDANRRVIISGNVVDSADIGIGTQASIYAQIHQNVVRNCATGIQAALHGSIVQDISIRNNIVDAGSVGVVGINGTVAAAGAASILRIGGNQYEGSFGVAGFVADAGWQVVNEDTYKTVVAGVAPDNGDASATLNRDSFPTQRWDTTLTDNRTVTLPTVDCYNGMRFRIVRTGLGAKTLDVGGLKTIGNSTAAFVDVEYNGSAWQLAAYGTL